MNADTQSEEVLLSTAELFSGQPYQRPVRDCDVAELVREWGPRLLTPLVVSYRDGRYNLVDGQHRVCAMRRKNGGKDVTALCRFYHGLTYEQEAELYYKLDKAKGHLRLSHSTKALVESGSNAEVLEIKRLLEEAGFIWALDKPTREPFEIEATRAVISAYRLLGARPSPGCWGCWPRRGTVRPPPSTPLSSPAWRCSSKPMRQSWMTMFL